MLLRISSISLSLFVLCSTAFATSIEESYCNLKGYTPPKRQTLFVIDGQVVHRETEKERKPENQEWREFVAKLLNTEDPGIEQRFAPRERATVAIAEADGSGITMLFAGCLPIYSKEEQAKLVSGSSEIDEFFGQGWKNALGKAREKFRRSMIVALVEGTANAKLRVAKSDTRFSDSSLVSSLLRGLPLSPENGIPRVIIYSDLSKYMLPEGAVVALRNAGRTDAERLGLNLQYSELHIIGASGREGGAGNEYIRAFFLAGKGMVETLVGKNGAFKPLNPPVRVSVYQGKIVYADGAYPMRMRLALDRNGTAVNSWVEDVSDRTRFTPFSGLLTCVTPDKCNFVGDRVFAQIWSDNPDPEPEFANWMPFAGFRELEFGLMGGKVSGRIKDGVGYVPGMEDGLKFELQRVENGLF